MQEPVSAPSATAQLIAVTPVAPTSDPSALWRIRDAASAVPGSAPGSPMESGLSVINPLAEAPPRTLHSAPLVKSSPLSPSVRAMLETREFGRCFDAVPIDLEALGDRLPSLHCPAGDVEFLASDRSLEDLRRSVDGLLQHRKCLLAPSIDPALPRRHVLVVGAGPAGLMAAIQMQLRDHRVVVCEPREVYARNRYIGVYKEVTHLMAALGMPERMTYDFSQYRGKRGIMLADIQTFLHAVALKLGVVIYTGAVARRLDLDTVRTGAVELQRAAHADAHSPSSIGMMRWQYDTLSRVRSGVTVRFDTILEASGGRSGLREALGGRENVVSIHELGRAAAAADPTLDSYFEDPEDHCAEYVDSGYGCPPGLRASFSAALREGDTTQIPEAIPCFVSNIDASILRMPMQQSEGSLGLASRIGDRTLSIPHDWVVLECRLADQTRSRYHIEGPLPQTFDFGGRRVPTPEALDTINPVNLLLRILYAMGVPFDAVDRRQLIEFYTTESSRGDASDIVSTWIGRFRGLRLAGERPLWRGPVPGAPSLAYGIIGEALQNAWYRFGVGVDDAFTGAAYFAAGFELQPAAQLAEAQRFARVMISRSVQILYHLYSVARNVDQGVVGPVLTEYHMEEQHSADLGEARLRDVAREGAEMLAAETDLRCSGSDALVEAALDHARKSCCERALALLQALPYPPELLTRARQAMSLEPTRWREQVATILGSALSPEHRTLLAPLWQGFHETCPVDAQRLWQERLVELGLGYYAWATPWLRACALHAVDPCADTAVPTLSRAAQDPDPLVAETARVALAACPGRSPAAVPALSIIEKVLFLRTVSIFTAIPDAVLAGIAVLLNERRAAADETIFAKGEVSDSLYVITAGRVRVHDGDRTLAVLGEHQFFGELSLLDAEPRAASVTALEPAHLLRLAQEDFYVLMSERPEVMRAINRALCAMVRGTAA